MMPNTMIPQAIVQHQIGEDAFNWLMAIQGKVFRDVKGRKTQQVKIGEQSYFIKQHVGVGWGEIIKSLLAFKRPVVSALTEVNAIKSLTAIGIPTTPLVAYGVRGNNPATLQSFVLTEDLGEIITLEDLCANWQIDPPSSAFRAMLTVKLAELSAQLHGAGLCHRDYYLCHFVIKKAEFERGEFTLILIDLHRMLAHQASDGGSVMKDIAALMFSAKDCGFDDADWSLFKEHYLPQNAQFWLKVEARAAKLYEKFHSQKFQKRLAAEKAALK